MVSLDRRRSLVVIIGASRFPKTELSGGSPFSRSVEAFLAYLLADDGFGLRRDNVLDLFDDSRPAQQQLQNISDFLREKQRTGDAAQLPENLLIYYVGHGQFTPNDRKYCLAVRDTEGNNMGLTSVRGSYLAEVVRGGAMHLRRFLILDCCFAGSMLGEFLSSPGEAANVQMIKDLPDKGTTLLCASSSQDVALAPTRLEYTMFSDALLKVLREGNPTLGEHLSMSELKLTLQNRLENDYPSGWPRPEVHSPDQREGDIASVPLFPNRAWSGLVDAGQKQGGRIKAVQAERDRLDRIAARKSEKERIAAHKAGEERIAAEKGEKQRIAAQKAEKERIAAQKAEQRIAAQKAERESIAAQKAEKESLGPGAITAVLLIGNLVTFWTGRFFANLFFDLGNDYHNALAFGGCLSAGLVGALLKLACRKAFEEDEAQAIAFTTWPGFLLGFRFLNTLSSTNQPSVWYAILVIVVFIISSMKFK